MTEGFSHQLASNHFACSMTLARLIWTATAISASPANEQDSQENVSLLGRLRLATQPHFRLEKAEPTATFCVSTMSRLRHSVCQQGQTGSSLATSGSSCRIYGNI